MDLPEVHPQYQDIYHLDPNLQNMKYQLRHHHLQMEMDEKLYLYLLQLVVDHAPDLIQVEHYAL